MPTSSDNPYIGTVTSGTVGWNVGPGMIPAPERPRGRYFSPVTYNRFKCLGCNTTPAEGNEVAGFLVGSTKAETEEFNEANERLHLSAMSPHSVLACKNCVQKLKLCNNCYTPHTTKMLAKYSKGRKKICQKCYKIKYNCKECDTKVFRKRNTVTTKTGSRFCPSCVKKGFVFKCYNCKSSCETKEEGRQANVLGHNYCKPCRGVLFSFCRRCEEHRPTNDVVRCVNCHEDSCPVCDHERSCTHGHRRRVKIDPPTRGTQPGKYLKIDRLVGFEIEAERGEEYALSEALNKKFGIVEDGSLNDGDEILIPAILLA